MIELTNDDWVEIYYALDTKAGKIEDGDYDDDDTFPGTYRAPVETWGQHLRSIMEKIGPDGKNMYSEKGMQALADEKCRCFLERAEKAEATIATLRELERDNSTLHATERALLHDLRLIKRDRFQLGLRVKGLEGAARADEERLIKAAEKAGIVYMGCDTPDWLAERILELEREVRREDSVD